nr:reverse transcriptase domain-containing protein [Tanacetum cinerariifolium]
MLMVEMVGMAMVETMDVLTRHSWLIIPETMMGKMVQARGREAAIGMSWVEFKALLVEEFCPSNEMEKLESEFWNHTMVEANHAGYTDRFHELAKLVPHLSAILKSGILTYKAVRCGTLTRSSEKRKEVKETSKHGGSWKDNKKENVGKGFVVTAPSRNENVGSYSKCAKFLLIIQKVDLVGCVSTVRNQVTLPETVARWLSRWRQLNRAPGQARHCLALEGNRNTQNNGNQAKGRAFSVNAVDALIVSHGYVIEVANGKKEEVDRIIRNCKLELGNSLFTIDLILLGHGSFEVIVGMDWLSKNKAKIVCHDKVVRIPLDVGEILRVQGERTLGGTKTLMSTRADGPELNDILIL